jgi:hypothetical protein
VTPARQGVHDSRGKHPSGIANFAWHCYSRAFCAPVGTAIGRMLVTSSIPALRCVIAAAAIVVGLTFVDGSPLAQQSAGQDNTNVDINTFTKYYWSQIVPNYSYLNGCVNGYRAFIFTPDGYFVFDGKVHGSWRLTTNNLLRVQTKASGNRPSQILELQFQSATTFTPIVPSNAVTTTPPNPANGTFDFRRYDLFQQCGP